MFVKFQQLIAVLALLLLNSIDARPRNNQNRNDEDNRGGRNGLGAGDREEMLDTRPRREFKQPERKEKEFRFSSVAKSERNKTKLDLIFETRRVPTFGLRFFQRDNDSLDISRMRIDLLQIIEFNATVPIETSTASLKFKNLPPTAAKWTQLDDTLGMKEEVVDGVTVKSLRSSLVFNSHPVHGNLNVTLVLYFSDGNAETEGFQVSPNGIKYSIYISNWRPRLTNSKLAIVKAIWTKDNSIEFNPASTSTNSSVKLGADGAGRFTWVQRALANGVPVKVNVSSALPLVRENRFSGDTERDDDDTEGHRGGSAPKVIAFELPLADTVVWDPELTYNSEFIGDLQNMGSSAGIVEVNFGFLVSILALFGLFA